MRRSKCPLGLTMIFSYGLLPCRRHATSNACVQALQKAEERASTLEMQSRSQVGGLQGPGGSEGQAKDAQDLGTRNKLLMVRARRVPESVSRSSEVCVSLYT